MLSCGSYAEKQIIVKITNICRLIELFENIIRCDFNNDNDLKKEKE